MTTERPILFSAPMVRALLDGRKTQTRRLLKKSTEFKGPYNPAYLEVHKNSIGWKDICPYGKPGDYLWVRESFCDARASLAGRVLYRATGDIACGWKPSIHMPRALSRITLHLTDVRVQRLQEISEADAKAEGVEPIGHDWRNYGNPSTRLIVAKGSYWSLWDSINGPGSWAANPWVWALTFNVL